MSIWHTPATVADLNKLSAGTIAEHVGIEFLEIGDDYITARMPVDHRTVQPANILHGGASVVLAETLGSVGAFLCEDPDQKHCVGLEINANHVRPARSGFVYGAAHPVHIGGSTQIWEIKITNENGKLVCVSRLTLAVLSKQ
jgi:1,4-dihydroxy-2-naphthoyl-CoA hydrolase